jgi:hypothetical protein
MSKLKWHAEAEIHGVNVRGQFFSPSDVDGREDFVARNLPVFQTARPKLLCTEKDRRNFRVGELVGQPDAVLEHGNGLIALEYKSCGGRAHLPNSWQNQLQLKDMLQCIGGAMVVAASLGKPTAAVLRAHGALYLLKPRPELLSLLAVNVPVARTCFLEERGVSISQLAKFCVALVEARFPRETEQSRARSLAGQQLHEQMLRA